MGSLDEGVLGIGRKTQSSVKKKCLQTLEEFYTLSAPPSPRIEPNQKDAFENLETTALYPSSQRSDSDNITERTDINNNVLTTVMSLDNYHSKQFRDVRCPTGAHPSGANGSLQRGCAFYCNCCQSTKRPFQFSKSAATEFTLPRLSNVALSSPPRQIHFNSSGTTNEKICRSQSVEGAVRKKDAQRHRHGDTNVVGSSDKPSGQGRLERSSKTTRFSAAVIALRRSQTLFWNTPDFPFKVATKKSS